MPLAPVSWQLILVFDSDDQNGRCFYGNLSRYVPPPAYRPRFTVPPLSSRIRLKPGASKLAENTNPCRKRIIIVSDDSKIYEHTASLVRASGYMVEQTATVDECAKYLQLHESAPDLILLDMDMEGVDTLGAVKAWLAMHLGQKIVALSFACNADAVVQTIRAGALDYVVKPLDEARITALLKQYLSNGLAATNAPAKLLPQATRQAL